MQQRMCGFSGILARGPNLPFVYFFEMEQAIKLAPTRRVFPSTLLLPPSPVDVFDCANYSTPLDFVCIQSTSLLPSSCIPGQAQDMCVEVPPTPPLHWLRTLAARINCVWWSKVISTALNYYYLQEVSTCSTIIQILCTCPATPTLAQPGSLEHPPSNTHKGCVCIGSV